MKLFLIAYGNAAIVVPALWIGARLWLRRHSRAPTAGLVSAQIIAFPIAMRGLKPKAHAQTDWEVNGERLTRCERRRLQKVDQYVAQRRRSLAKKIGALSVWLNFTKLDRRGPPHLRWRKSPYRRGT
jgi:hypothetical protein